MCRALGRICVMVSLVLLINVTNVLGQCTEEQLRKLEEIEDYWDVFTPQVNMEYRAVMDDAAEVLDDSFKKFQKAGEDAAAKTTAAAESGSAGTVNNMSTEAYDGLFQLWGIFQKGKAIDAAVTLKRVTDGAQGRAAAAVENCKKELEPVPPGVPGQDPPDVRTGEPGTSDTTSDSNCVFCTLTGPIPPLPPGTVSGGTVVDVDCPEHQHYDVTRRQCVPDDPD